MRGIPRRRQDGKAGDTGKLIVEATNASVLRTRRHPSAGCPSLARASGEHARNYRCSKPPRLR